MDFLSPSYSLTCALVASAAAWIGLYFYKSTPRARQWQWWSLWMSMVLAAPLTWWTSEVYQLPNSWLNDLVWLELWLCLSALLSLIPVVWLRFVGMTSLTRPLNISALAASIILAASVTTVLIGFATGWLISLLMASVWAIFGWWGVASSMNRMISSIATSLLVLLIVAASSLIWGALWPEYVGYELLGLGSLLDSTSLAIGWLIGLGIPGVYWQVFGQSADR